MRALILAAGLALAGSAMLAQQQPPPGAPATPPVINLAPVELLPGYD